MSMCAFGAVASGTYRSYTYCGWASVNDVDCSRLPLPTPPAAASASEADIVAVSCVIPDGEDDDGGGVSWAKLFFSMSTTVSLPPEDDADAIGTVPAVEGVDAGVTPFTSTSSRWLSSVRKQLTILKRSSWACCRCAACRFRMLLLFADVGRTWFVAAIASARVSFRICPTISSYDIVNRNSTLRPRQKQVKCVMGYLILHGTGKFNDCRLCGRCSRGGWMRAGVFCDEFGAAVAIERCGAIVWGSIDIFEPTFLAIENKRVERLFVNATFHTDYGGRRHVLLFDMLRRVLAVSKVMLLDNIE